MLNKGVPHFPVRPSSLLRFLRRNLCISAIQFRKREIEIEIERERKKETSRNLVRSVRIELY